MILPSAAEIKAAIPEKGITISEIMKTFLKGQVSNETRSEFFKTVKTVTTYEKGTKLLKPMK